MLEVATSSDALRAIQDHALEEHKSVHVESQGGGHKLIKYKSKTCSFFVRVYKYKDKYADVLLPWYISSCELTHLNCTTQPKPTQRQVAAMQTVHTAVLADRFIVAKAVIKKVQGNEAMNLEVHKRMVYRAMDNVKVLANGSRVQGFTKVPSLLKVFEDLNPGSLVDFEKDDYGRFFSKTVGLDGAHAKNPRYNGTQLLPIGRDGNFQNITLAVALVDKETIDNYEWFARNCVSGGTQSNYPLVSDRNASLIDVCTRHQIKHMYCTLHTIRNVIAGFSRFSARQKALAWRIQHSTTVEEYNCQLAVAEIERGQPVADYLRSIDPVHLVVFANIGNVPMYGWRTSNVVESENGATLVEGMREMEPGSESASKWGLEGQIVTPNAMIKYKAQNRRMGEYSVTASTLGILYVWATNALPQMPYRVIISQKKCTCVSMDQWRISCRHYVAALHCVGKMDDVCIAFGKKYLVSSYAKAFGDANIQISIESEIVSDASVFLAPFVRRARRPVKRRFCSDGEDGPAKVYKCSKCASSGHNSCSCDMGFAWAPAASLVSLCISSL